MTTRLLCRALCLMALLCTISHFSLADNHPDPSAPEQGVTFSNVYKIDIPGSSSCKLERLPTQDEAGLQTETTTNGENDIIFRHNIRLQTPKCDCEVSESFKSLLYRVNGLEEEVNYLKTQCTQGCCGGGGAAGVDTSCSGHGTYQHDTCSCLCNPGWEGPDCSVSSCPDECNDNGRCVDGKCVCHQGYTGDDCSQLMCPDNCNDKGHCVDGKCVCFPHFTGEDCSIQKCPNDCIGNGQCVDGQCICDEGFYGEDCSLVFGPQGLRLVQVTDVSLLVEWESVRGAEHYILTYHPKYDESSLEQVRIPNTENSYLITGLIPGVTYIVKVYAVIKEIQSEADKIEATTDVSAIDDIRVLGQTEVSIQVDWKNPPAEVDHFRLTHTDPEGQEKELSILRSQEARTKHTIVGLYPGTEYMISVQAIKGTTEGKQSSVTGVTDIDAPTNLVTTEVTEDTATVSWDRAQAEIEGYMLSYTSAGGSSSEIPVGRDSTSYRLVGLRPGVLHTVYIWAFKGDKVSRKSSTEAETEMDAPTNVLAHDETESSFIVSWDHTQAEIDGYILTYSSSEGSSEEIPVGSDSTSYNVTGLRPGVVYTVHIWAIKGDKTSRKISTQAETELDAPANLLARDETESSFSVSWDSVQADIDGYILTYSSSEGSSGEIRLGPESTSYSLTGLRPGVLYTVYIWAIKGNKVSRKISTQAETELDAPANLLARDETESSFSVSWDSVQADIDGYILTYSSSEGSSGEIRLGPESTSYSLTGLRPGVLYTVYIWAIKGNKVSRKISTQAETELDAPANLLARDETESSFSVSWDPVQADIDGYILTYSSSEGSSEEIPVRSDSTSYSLTGLRPAVLYNVYIWAFKGSKASRKISTQAETDIDAPRDLKATDVTLESASLTWIPPLADIEGYILTYRDEDGNMETVEKQLGASESSFVVSSLEMGKRYIVTIIAYRGSKRSKVVETIFKTVGLLYPFPMDCVQIMKNGNKQSGIYTVYINNDPSKPIEVYCDMDTDGGGWLMLQRRTTGKLDFMKRWRQYIAGFGNMTDEFWLGLDKIYELTNTPTQYELRFDLGLGSERAYAVYDNFKIAPVKQKFKLTIGKYRGTAGDAMTYHQGRPWTTVDSDNDIALGNCALTHRGAWWYKNCHLANLNGKWGDNRHSLGVNWEPWKGHLESLDFTEMKIRPLGALSSRKRRSLLAREKSRNTNLLKKQKGTTF
ncbi:tenascin-N isoform X1 [Trachinotus anak]|uniref:tenascin-N isoform X1 n=1 Tax=Trachinotus anak TaxID=443729 RepID=UPI0039F260D5